MTERLRLGAALSGRIDLTRAEQAGGASVLVDDGRIRIVTPPPAFAFAAAILISHGESDPHSVVIEIDVAEADGPVLFSFATLDMRREVRPSVGYAPGHREQVRAIVSNFREAGWILVRNGDKDGRQTQLVINGIRIYPTATETLPEPADVGPGRIGKVDLALLAAVADAVDNPFAPLDRPDPLMIDAVPVELIGGRLGFAESFDMTQASQRKLTEWKMEDDDQPILRYLYRNAKPRRHLEFGTWQGAGTVYCLDECDATAWTINLAEGEKFAEGHPAYYTTGAQTAVIDAGSMIGKLYREAGYGNRVCQIYSDSLLWDISNYPPGFFDSVLIDGGHQADVVINDTQKALTLLRSGGLCLWHDFAADPAVFGSSPASIGVTQGLRAVWSLIAAEMRDIFWIYPSFILAGIRR
ncbi:MAG TPA: class I SAM-dependent methyltransferase [Alphaproteobacteria bacterium]|nr:class I SAM-dependent methyltransferase [Alphaproteobacteria bacterium]